MTNSRKLRSWRGCHWCPKGCGKKVNHLKDSRKNEKPYCCDECGTWFAKAELAEIQTMCLTKAERLRLET